MSDSRFVAILWTGVLVLGLAVPAYGLNAYVPISQTVARGQYCAPNYLSAVRIAVGQDAAYRMFGGVLQDNRPNLVGRFGKDEMVVEALRRSKQQYRNILGWYAEDRFVEMNREAGWRKVANPFAPQRDVWRRVEDRIQYGQIKVHGLSASAPTMRKLAEVYIDSMEKDSGRGQASLFLVPDDHVQSIRAALDERHARAVEDRDAKSIAWLASQKKRLNRLGVTYDTLRSEADAAQAGGRARLVARHVGPLLSVVFLAGSAGYDTYKWWSGELSGGELVVRLGETGAMFTLAATTAHLAAKFDFFAARPYGVGGVVTAVVFLGEEALLVRRLGGISNALAVPEFYITSGANFGAATLGLIGAVEGGKLGAAIGTPLGPWGTAIGGGLGAAVGGAVGGLVGYLGGATLTDWMLETLAPEFYYGVKMEQIDKAEERCRAEIRRLLYLSRPITTGDTASS